MEISCPRARVSSTHVLYIRASFQGAYLSTVYLAFRTPTAPVNDMVPPHGQTTNCRKYLKHLAPGNRLHPRSHLPKCTPNSKSKTIRPRNFPTKERKETKMHPACMSRIKSIPSRAIVSRPSGKHLSDIFSHPHVLADVTLLLTMWCVGLHEWEFLFEFILLSGDRPRPNIFDCMHACMSFC